MEEEKSKICPLLSINKEETESCLEEACAWWDKTVGHCAITALATDGVIVHK